MARCPTNTETPLASFVTWPGEDAKSATWTENGPNNYCTAGFAQGALSDSQPEAAVHHIHSTSIAFSYSCLLSFVKSSLLDGLAGGFR